LLRVEAKDWDLHHWGELLGQLVTDAPAPARVKVASVAILLSLVFFLLVIWSWLFLPRDPSTFYKPEQRSKAVHYYVKRLKGGLCYALLSWGNGERVEEAADIKQLQRLCPHMPKIDSPAQPARERTPDDQIQFWRTMARRLHERQDQLDALIEPAQQGRNRR